jgi:hypothetical protein
MLRVKKTRGMLRKLHTGTMFSTAPTCRSGAWESSSQQRMANKTSLRHIFIVGLRYVTTAAQGSLCIMCNFQPSIWAHPFGSNQPCSQNPSKFVCPIVDTIYTSVTVVQQHDSNTACTFCIPMCHHADLRILTRSDRVAILDPVQNESNILKNKVLDQFDLSWSIMIYHDLSYGNQLAQKPCLKQPTYVGPGALSTAVFGSRKAFACCHAASSARMLRFPASFDAEMASWKRSPKKDGKTSTTMGCTTFRFSERSYYIIWYYMTIFA